MAVITIKLAPVELMMDLMFGDQRAVAKQNLDSYKVATHFVNSSVFGIDAAEEAFDVTNNPSRQEERELVYGRGRSVSVGDVVNVDGVDYVCCACGWEQL